MSEDKKSIIAINPSVDENQWQNIRRFFQILSKRKWLIITTLVVVVGTVSVWTFTRTRIYKATASVLIDNKAPQVLGNAVNEVVDISTGGFWRNTEYMETQCRVINSSALSSRLAQKLNLKNSQLFWGMPPKKQDGSSFTDEEAANALLGMISARPVRDSNLLEISVQHPNPTQAAQLANTLARIYIDQNIEYKISSTSGAVEWLSNQLDDLKKQLEGAEFDLYDFKKKHNLISLSLEDKQSIVVRQIQNITDALTDIRIKRMHLDAQRKQIQSEHKADMTTDPMEIAVGPVMDSIVIQRLKEVLVEEQRKYVALREKYLDRHPQVLEQKAKVVAARHDLEREVKNLFSSMESKFKEVKENERQLAAALQVSKNEVLELNKHEVTFQRLQRNKENTSNLYSLILTRMKESDLSGQLRVNNMRMLDQAKVPKAPVSPIVRNNLIIGFLLGLILGIGLAFLVDTLDTSIKSQEDVQQVPELVFLGLMPRIPGAITSRKGKRPAPNPELDLIVHRSPKSSVAESCRSIRTNILFASTDRTMKTMVVTSPGPREGKTTTAVSLAIAMSQAGSRVLIVDTDMRRPRLHRVFGVSAKEGITSVLLGSAKLEDVIKTTEVPGLYALPCGPTPPNPAEICQGERFKTLLGQLINQFDRVILDSPPVTLVTDAVVLSTLADGTLLVARTGVTSKAALEDSTRNILDVGGTLLGCVLNDMDLEQGGYGFNRYRRYGYYRYGYGKRYGAYGEGYSHYGEEKEASG